MLYVLQACILSTAKTFSNHNGTTCRIRSYWAQVRAHTFKNLAFLSSQKSSELGASALVVRYYSVWVRRESCGPVCVLWVVGHGIGQWQNLMHLQVYAKDVCVPFREGSFAVLYTFASLKRALKLNLKSPCGRIWSDLVKAGLSLEVVLESLGLLSV